MPGGAYSLFYSFSCFLTRGHPSFQVSPWTSQRSGQPPALAACAQFVSISEPFQCQSCLTFGWTLQLVLPSRPFYPKGTGPTRRFLGTVGCFPRPSNQKLKVLIPASPFWSLALLYFTRKTKRAPSALIIFSGLPEFLLFVLQLFL